MKGECASALRGSGARMLFAESDPFCALQAELRVVGITQGSVMGTKMFH